MDSSLGSEKETCGYGEGKENENNSSCPFVGKEIFFCAYRENATFLGIEIGNGNMSACALVKENVSFLCPMAALYNHEPNDQSCHSGNRHQNQNHLNVLCREPILQQLLFPRAVHHQVRAKHLRRPSCLQIQRNRIPPLHHSAQYVRTCKTDPRGHENEHPKEVYLFWAAWPGPGGTGGGN